MLTYQQAQELNATIEEIRQELRESSQRFSEACDKLEAEVKSEINQIRGDARRAGLL